MTTMTIRTRPFTSEQTGQIKADPSLAARNIRDAVKSLDLLRSEIFFTLGKAEKLNPEMWQERLNQIFATLPAEAVSLLAEMSAAAEKPMDYQAIAHLDETVALEDAQAYFVQGKWSYYHTRENRVVYRYPNGSKCPWVILIVEDGQVTSVGLSSVEQSLLDLIANLDGKSLIAAVAQSVGRNR